MRVYNCLTSAQLIRSRVSALVLVTTRDELDRLQRVSEAAPESLPWSRYMNTLMRRAVRFPEGARYVVIGFVPIASEPEFPSLPCTFYCEKFAACNEAIANALDALKSAGCRSAGLTAILDSDEMLDLHAWFEATRASIEAVKAAKEATA